MKASKFTDVQKAIIVQHGQDGAPLTEICRDAVIGPAEIFQPQGETG